MSFGRHFLLNDNSLLLVGRNQSDNNNIAALAMPGDCLLKTQERPGPQGLIRGGSTPNNDTVRLAASIVASYSDTKDLPLVKVRIVRGEEIGYVEVEARDRAEMPPSL